MEPQPSRLQRKERSHKRFTLLLPLGLSLHRGTLQLLLKDVHDGEKETTSSEIFLFCNSPEELKATFSFISYTANTFTWNALAELFKCDLKPLIHFTSLFYVLCFRKHPNFFQFGINRVHVFYSVKAVLSPGWTCDFTSSPQISQAPPTFVFSPVWLRARESLLPCSVFV